MMLFSVIFLLASGRCFTSPDTGVGGQKDETDVILNSFKEAAKSVDNLAGLDYAEKIAVLVIRQGEESLYTLEGGKLVNVPGGSSNTHNPMIEDLIIDQLMQIGDFKVVEILDSYYGSLHIDLNSGLENNLENIKNIGEAIGADTIIIGSSAGSIMKYVTVKKFFGLSSTTYFVSSVKLNLRTVDVKTSTVTSTVIGSGTDRVKVASKSPLMAILTAIGLAVMLGSGG